MNICVGISLPLKYTCIAKHMTWLKTTLRSALFLFHTYFLNLLDVPSAPDMPSVDVQSHTSAALKWTAPSSDGGSRITHYIVEYRMQGFVHWREEKTSSTSLSHTIQGLTKNSTYTFRVKAVNAAGESQPSEECDPIKIAPAGCKSQSAGDIG